jgi:hypothetical protein
MHSITHKGGTSMKQGKIVDEHGNTFYYKDDKLHSYNDLPAVEFATGTKEWYKNGKAHRLSGPATIFCDGREGFYFIDGKWLTKEQHANRPEVKKYKLQQILNRLTA